MALDLGSFKEHADVIAVLGLLFAAWSSKRILGKLEKNISDNTDAITELDTKVEAELKAQNTTCEQRSKDIHKRIDTIQTERDKQVGEIDRKLSVLIGEHKATHHIT